MTDDLRKEIRQAVDRISDVHSSNSSEFMHLVRLSGLPRDFLKGRVVSGLDLSNSDLTSLDLTGTEFVNCTTNSETKFPPNIKNSLVTGKSTLPKRVKRDEGKLDFEEFYQLKPERGDVYFRELVIKALVEIFGKGKVPWTEIYEYYSDNHKKLLAEERLDGDWWNTFRKNTSLNTPAGDDQHYLKTLYWLYKDHDDKGQEVECNRAAEKIVSDYWDCSIDQLYARLQNAARASEAAKVAANQIDTFISVLMNEHIPHPIENDFTKFLNSHDRGVWHLSSSPGKGKTVVMASIATLYKLGGSFFSSSSGKEKSGTISWGDRQLKENIVCIPYFFGRGFQGRGYRESEWIYKFLISRICQIYDQKYTLKSKQNLVSDFESFIRDLNKEGIINKKSPLIFVIDALDEQGLEDSQLMNAIQQFLFCGLPEGVYIVCSQMVAEGSRPLPQVASTPNYRNADLDAKGHQAGHRATVEKYVANIARARDLLTAKAKTHQNKSSEAEITKFAKEHSNNADYNFMLLRYQLNDERFWQDKADGEIIGNSQDDYYTYLHKRMTSDGTLSIAVRASYCFALRRRMSRFAFMRLLGQIENSKGARETNELLDKWKSQGLIYERGKGSSALLCISHSTYHRFLEQTTYRPLLEPELSTSGSLRISCADNILHDIDPKGSFHFLDGRSNEEKREWIELSLLFLIRAHCFDNLEALLNNLEFWRLSTECEEGIGLPLKALNQVIIVADGRPALKAIFEVAARKVLDWAKRGLIEKPSGEKYTLADVRRFADHTNNDRNQDTIPVSFSGFFVQKNWRLPPFEMSDDDQVILNSLYRGIRASRNNREIEASYEVLEKIKSLLDKYDSKYVAKYMSRYFYRLGFLQDINGKPDEAVENFKMSAQVARDDGDDLRSGIGDFSATLTLFLEGRIDAEKAYQEFAALEAKWPQADEVSGEDKHFRIRSEFNLIKRLFDVSFEAGRDECVHWGNRLLTHEYLQMDSENINPIYELTRARVKARLAIYREEFEDAVSIYAAYLNVSIPDLVPFEVIQMTDESKIFARAEPEEICRDYLFLGRALIQTTRPDRKAEAISVWQQGMQIENKHGNILYIIDMHRELSTLASVN